MPLYSSMTEVSYSGEPRFYRYRTILSIARQSQLSKSIIYLQLSLLSLSIIVVVILYGTVTIMVMEKAVFYQNTSGPFNYGHFESQVHFLWSRPSSCPSGSPSRPIQLVVKDGLETCGKGGLVVKAGPEACARDGLAVKM